MYLIDAQNKKIDRIDSKTFQELGFWERKDLQEWIEKTPSCLGDEELLIIQKEFDRFNDTNERLDLLALDKEGTLVVIENKRDDSGKDVCWQALKYVSYCSTLKTQQIVEIYQEYLDKYFEGTSAKDKMEEFFGIPLTELHLNDRDQRIILVAGSFRKEVTSTALWMLNHGLRIQCFQASLFDNEGEILLDIEQIIPIKGAEEYMISMADKAKEDESTKASSNKTGNLRKRNAEDVQGFAGKGKKTKNETEDRKPLI